MRPTLWLVAALAILVPGLGSEPVDLLEYSYFHEAVRPATVGRVLTNAISAELAHGPIEPLILRAMASLSASPWALRAPSAVFGVLFVLVVLAIGRRTLPPLATVGVTAVALTAPVAVYYARDATPYALAGLCAAVSVLILLHVARLDLRQRARPAWWIAFAALQVLGFFSHYGYAFVSISLLIGVAAAWMRRRPGLLACALTAFAAAAVLPAILVRELWTMVVSSGIRFTLMSPAYPDSPGLSSFIADFLTVLTGLPVGWSPGLLITLPLWVLGLRAIHRRSPLLAWLVGAQAVLILAFLVFSHTMSVTVGGGRVFYAYRWTRPLLLGMVLPLGAAAATRARGLVLLLVAVAASQCILQIARPTRPGLDEVREFLSSRLQPGDAYAVLPAAFYGDLAQFHLAAGAPPDLITSMRTVDLPLGDHTVRGPLVELDLPLETVTDRLQYRRIWVIDIHEEMFGTPKFRPRAASLPGRTVGLRHELPFVTITRHDCDVECAWIGRRRILIDPNRPLEANRYARSAPGYGEPDMMTELFELAPPPNAKVRVLEDGEPAPDRLQLHRGGLRVDLSNGGHVTVELTR